MLKNLKDFNVRNKRVLVRCDLNTPLDGKGSIADNFRIKKIVPTIHYLISAKAKIILMSHLGEPKGRKVKKLKFDKVKKELELLIGSDIVKSDDCIGPAVKNQIWGLKQGQVLLLENLRFHKEEESNNQKFAKKLALLGEIYINDAFSVCHRSHASVAGVPHYLPHGAGFLLVQELENMDKVLENPKKPFVVLIGGLKAKTKEKFIGSILRIADCIIIGGALKKELIKKGIVFEDQEKIIGPDNHVGLDISSEAIRLFSGNILSAKTILWNGPFGKFEDEKYEKGTLEIAKLIIQSEAFSVVGGGETVEFLNKKGLTDRFSHTSTGGGAMLAYLAGETLPGLEALNS